ncbi:MAG: helix-turn-helix transcriptional regulator [Clostridia bacterium]|nr:helix-turn-helix transcriptional regulator [Clostridia bacterium]
MSFSTQLKQRRMRLCKTQKQMATALGISLETYRKWEKGTSPITLRQMIHISEIFGISLFDMIE